MNFQSLKKFKEQENLKTKLELETISTQNTEMQNQIINLQNRSKN